jgi:serine/threonine protein phosphatase PrpC
MYMEIIAAYCTDVGNVKEINQDSLSVKVVNSPNGKIVFAVVCDGMGGLEHGEVASREVVVAFSNWFSLQFAKMVADDTFTSELVRGQWQALVEKMNENIGEYAEQKGMMMGTTVSALLFYQGQFYVCHVGDSRIYKIDSKVEQMTNDHTLVAQEVALGTLTEEEAAVDPRRSILLQCVGASDVVETQYEMGRVEEDTTFLLSSDGFVHLVSEDELYERFHPQGVLDKEQLSKKCQDTVKLVMDRGERDNVSVIAVTIKQDK